MVSEHKRSVAEQAPRACSLRKRAYMKHYNKRADVKDKKAAYMRRVRSEADKEAARRLVSFLLERGHEDMAYDYALERAPEMLVTVKGRRAVKR